MQCYIIPQALSFVNDNSPKIRKEVALQLINISENIPQDIFKKKLLPIYKKLSTDSNYLLKRQQQKFYQVLQNNVILKQFLKNLYLFLKILYKMKKVQ